MEKSIFFDVSLYSYLLAAMLYMLWLLSQKRLLSYLSTATLILGLISLTVFIVQRWIVANYPPFSNTFETLVFFAWIIVFQYLLVEFVTKHRFLGVGASFLAMFILAASTFFPSAIRPLMPALQNNFWLTVHVILCFISYAAFAFSFLAAMLYLLRQSSWHMWLATFLIALLVSSGTLGTVGIYCYKTGKLPMELNYIVISQFIFAIVILSAALWFPLFFLLSRKKWQISEIVLEQIVYRAIAWGFPFLAMGILSGSIWANQAWGSYWGWDPKETWSLITWIIYAIYLHARYMVGWRGPRLAWLAVIGFLSVIFTYFGVNYLLSGLHAYA